MLYASACLDEPNLHTLVQGRSDPVQHRQGMAFIVGIFQTTDDRRGRADELGQLSLSEARLDAESSNLPRDVVVRPRRFERREPFWLALIIAAMEDVHRVRGR